MKYRISKKTLSQMPAEVAEMIASVGADYSLKSFTYEQKPAGSKVYHAEGSRYFYVYAGRSERVEMVAEHNIGAAGVRHEIGAEIAPPVGTTVIEVWYLSGFGMHVTNIGDLALSAAA